ncbi:UDP-N-acetylglucosamine 1-carboxyvinyltransferase [Candidatus Peregrinibacteria bacterium]|jgi:UDP-N-acetylglucosamine 1-carboxyvinyltransferase|nr:UDP-N-acetylglucosamine 1-carboxyvinyltransferase [Candidatus Peregrinibacteria bacterium]MBT3598252.1 UDP-N-acetylglucosamine 1-carboxyvinyltransferase [Candidatus Peregrinibacteria bacterium]MBT4366776.1 UDP-N-acetylglucosamine 1-carboxyvinyltransferase [Candidatus Peregrinibacteria bacterium]MBT4585573.1 UDP-N-acetylglucosamine 1-carboxyvinyltransferase [Candidatus Peregrinibacteria bacterium]MBT6731001.1 UDP-N-acetylglucosamine 1-carboxyvinyltransferase [Candidatus Peregrinibacteria bact
MTATDIQYRVQGGVPLNGDVTISGSKNAALPLIAGAVLCSGETVLENVPDLRDVRTLLDTLNFLGAETSFQNGTVRIRSHNMQNKPIPIEYVGKLRGSIVLLGPLLSRFGVVEMAYPGGCVLGKRPVEAHITALKCLGAQDMSTDQVLHMQGALKPGHIILPEFSVTATENAILAAALLPGETRIDLAACEPHVREIQKFVESMGAQVEEKGSHTLLVRGTPDLHCVTHRVPFDYLEAGALAIAALVTKGKVRLHDVDNEHLLSFIESMRKLGAVMKYDKNEKILFVDGELSSLNAISIKTNIFPGFPTDLQAPFGVALTQARGVSRVFERLFEGRMAYLYELEKMGAQVEILNSHEALIIGPTQLRGRTVASNDIRAGAAMVIAALCAEGETAITDVRYIERGYDRLEEKLTSLGAKIEKIEIPVLEEAKV